MTPCRQCDLPVQENEEFCPNRHWHGYPNVKMAYRERPMLLSRVSALATSMPEPDREQLQCAVQALVPETAAVVCVDVDFAVSLLNSDRMIYATYANQICAGVRRRALSEDDCARTAIEGQLFGGLAPVVYAALAAPGQGLRSYGALALRLKEVAIADRASLLEENSYTFVRKHAGKKLPHGFRATWPDRDALIFAKVSCDFSGVRDLEDTRARLLKCFGSRDSDLFIEVHIWGGFGIFAVQSIEVLAPPRDEDERDLYRIAEARAGRKGIEWKVL
ncbi:MAG TPA: hypothetical protein VE974_21765 [Thermoanaerobaculia bacterium]|nr:hypothetical protein [Thermoanaerobaculia bacterium]